MRSEKLEKKLLLQRVKNTVKRWDGIRNIQVLESLDFDYDEQYKKICRFYQYDAEGVYIPTHEQGVRIKNDYLTVIVEELEKHLSLNIKYYISYEGKFFSEFEIFDFKRFYISYVKNEISHSLSIFNANEVLVVNRNEYDISVHYESN